MKLLSWLVYIPLQILFLPLTIVGSAIVGYRQIVVSKRLGASQTGIEILNGRWTLHVFGLRHDPPTAQLAAEVPNTSTFGLWLALFPLWLKYRICGEHAIYPRLPREGAESIADLVAARTVHFDRLLEEASRDAEQFVLLGAGYDTRAYGALRREGLAFFELDQRATQQVKLAGLQAAGIDTEGVTFVEVDFTKETPFDALAGTVYDPRKATVFLWEGVTLYLSEDDVRSTVRQLRENAGPGSTLVADFYGGRMLQLAKRGPMKKTLELTDEAVGFGFGFEEAHDDELRAFLRSMELTVESTHYLGADHEKGPYAAVVAAKLQG